VLRMCWRSSATGATPLCVCALCVQDESVAARVQALLSTPRFRCYRTTDVAGVELGGALKNVLAIACGELCNAVEPLGYAMPLQFESVG